MSYLVPLAFLCAFGCNLATWSLFAIFERRLDRVAHPLAILISASLTLLAFILLVVLTAPIKMNFDLWRLP